MLNSSPEYILDQIEQRVLLWRMVWALPENLRCVITHLYVCDRSVEEASIILGMSQNFVNVLHDKAIDNLRVRIRNWH